MFRVGLIALAAAMATPAVAADNVESVVKACVERAFYNPADKTVQNNVINVFARAALFPGINAWRTVSRSHRRHSDNVTVGRTKVPSGPTKSRSPNQVERDVCGWLLGA